MTEPAADVSATIEYSMDKWLIDHVPWALWICAGGLVVVLHADSQGVNGLLQAFVYLALLGVVFAGFVSATLITRSGISFFADIAIHILIFVVVVAVVAFAAATIGVSARWTSGVYGSLRWSTMLNPPPHVFGWMMIYLGLGWIVFAVFRHFRPARPILMLSPAGIMFHRSWLPDLFIPWQDVRGVGPFEPGGRPVANPQVITVLVTEEFYQQRIAPKQRFFAPPGSEFMFQPAGEMVQMVLNSAEVAVAIPDYRIPIETRWKAFRDQPQSTVPPVGPLASRVVHGRWSIDGSWRQSIRFLSPLVVMVAAVAHALFT